MYLTSAEQRSRITSLDLLATLCLMQASRLGVLLELVLLPREPRGLRWKC